MAYRATERTEAHREGNRLRIMEAARELVLSGGFAAVSMTSVAAGAGVATGTLYRHFSGKIDLCTELFRQASMSEVEHVRQSLLGPENAAEKLERTVRLFERRAIRGRFLTWALIAEPLDPALEKERLVFRRAYADVFCDLLEEGISQGEFEAQDPRISATALVGLLAEVLTGPLEPSRQRMSKSQQRNMIDDICRFALRAVGSKRKLK